MANIPDVNNQIMKYGMNMPNTLRLLSSTTELIYHRKCNALEKFYLILVILNNTFFKKRKQKLLLSTSYK